MNINKLKDEIAHQTRNGRMQVFIKREDLEELGEKVESKEERVFVEVRYVLGLIKQYEKKSFKEGLKVDVKPIERQEYKVEEIEKEK